MLVEEMRATALAYHALGANVLAIPEGKKGPTYTWKRWCAERQQVKDVQSLPWNGRQHIPAASGVGIVNGLNGWRSFDFDDCPDFTPVVTLLQALGLPETYPWVERSGSEQGWHVWVRCFEEVPQGALSGKDKAPGVFTGLSKDDSFHHLELRFKSCQTTVTPSVHQETGKRYEWRRERPVEAPAMVTADALIRAFYSVTAPPPAPVLQEPRKARQTNTRANDVKTEIRRRFDLVAYALARFGGEMQQEHDGQIRIKGHGGLLIRRGEEVWYTFAHGVGGDCFDLVGKYLYNGTWNRNDRHMFVQAINEAADFAGVVLPDTRQASWDVHMDAPNSICTNEEPGEIVDEDEDESPERPANSSCPPLPASAHLPEGLGRDACLLLDEYIAFSRLWSPRSFDDFHEACALWLLSTIAARRVVTHLGGPQYSNLYIALCARTSLWAKSTTAKIAIETIRQAGLSSLLAPDDSTPQAFVASMSVRVPSDYARMTPDQQEALKQRLAFAAQRGWHYEEFGQKISAMMRENGAMTDYRGLLRRLDDCPEQYETATIGRGTDLLTRPYLALLANLTPADMAPFAKKNSTLWGDGFFARFGFVTPPADVAPPMGKFPQGERSIPASIVMPLRKWHERLGVPQVDIAEVTNDQGEPTGQYQACISAESPPRLELGPGVYDAFYRYHDALILLTHQNGSTDLDGNYTRLSQKALRIAMLLASVDNSPAIEMCHWARAQEIAERWRRNLHALIDQLQGATTQSRESELEDHVVRTIDRLEKATLNELRRYIKGPSTDELARVVDSLERHGRVIVARNRMQNKVYRVQPAANRRTVEEENRREDTNPSTIGVNSADVVDS